VAFLPNLELGSAEVRVRLTPGKSLSGRVVIPPDVTDVDVWVSDGAIHWEGVVHPDGRFAISGLPEGTWHVRASGSLDGRSCFGTANIATGASGEIRIEAWRPR
jgi:hypothetical protein